MMNNLQKLVLLFCFVINSGLQGVLDNCYEENPCHNNQSCSYSENLKKLFLLAIDYLEKYKTLYDNRDFLYSNYWLNDQDNYLLIDKIIERCKDARNAFFDTFADCYCKDLEEGCSEDMAFFKMIDDSIRCSGKQEMIEIWCRFINSRKNVSFMSKKPCFRIIAFALYVIPFCNDNHLDFERNLALNLARELNLTLRSEE